MVTTRASSHGIHDGDSLALRSRDVPDSSELMPSKRRREEKQKSNEPSPSQMKKRKMTETDLTAVGHQDVVLKSAQQPNGEFKASEQSPIGLSGHKATAVSPLEPAEDFISFPPESVSEPFAPGTGHVSKSVKKNSSTPRNNNTSSPPQAFFTPFTRIPGASDQETPSGEKSINGRAPSQQAAAPKTHKRFGSEDADIGAEDATTSQQQFEHDSARYAEAETNVANDKGASDEDEDDDAGPEIMTSKTLAHKDVKTALPAAKRSKRKPKPRTTTTIEVPLQALSSSRTTPQEKPSISEPVPLSESEPTRPIDPAFEASNSPTHDTTSKPHHQAPSHFNSPLQHSAPSSPLRLTHGVSTQNTNVSPKFHQVPSSSSSSSPLPMASIRHKPSSTATTTATTTMKHLPPPKSTTGRNRLQSQLLTRKRVQYLWDGRTAFVQSTRS